MNINKLLDELKKLPNANRLPQFISVTAVTDSQLIFDGKVQNAIYKWGISEQEGEWIYFETDADRGYISYRVSFGTEREVLEYAKQFLRDRLEAFSNNTNIDMAARYVKKTYGYSEEQSYKLVRVIAEHEDIFEEFYNYFQYEEYGSDDGTQLVIHGFTAEKLVMDYKMSPLEAYIFLRDLRENPEETLQKIR